MAIKQQQNQNNTAHRHAHNPCPGKNKARRFPVTFLVVFDTVFLLLVGCLDQSDTTLHLKLYLAPDVDPLAANLLQVVGDVDLQGLDTHTLLHTLSFNGHFSR